MVRTVWSRYLYQLAAQQVCTCSDGCGGCLVTNDGHEDTRMCGYPVSADAARSKQASRVQASLISPDVLQTTAALQESWHPLYHGSSAHMRVSWVSRHPHLENEHPLLTSSNIFFDLNCSQYRDHTSHPGMICRIWD